MIMTLSLQITNLVLGTILFAWAGFDALRAKTTAGRICNALLAVEGLIVIAVAVAVYVLASTAPA